MAVTGRRALGLSLTPALRCSHPSWDPQSPPPLGLGGLDPPGQMTTHGGLSSVGLYWLGRTCRAAGVGATVAWAGGTALSHPGDINTSCGQCCGRLGAGEGRVTPLLP